MSTKFIGDIRFTREFIDDENSLAKLRDIVQNRGALEKLPTELIRPIAAFLYTTDSGDESWLPSAVKSEWQEISRTLADSLGAALQDLETREWLNRGLQRLVQLEQSDQKAMFNEITQVAGFPSLMQLDDRLVPVIRLAFRGKKNEMLLDTTADWDDLLFVAHAVLGHLRSHTESCRDFLENPAFHVENVNECLSKLREIDGATKGIREVVEQLESGE